ncbi:MAG: hypothetical protein JXC32_20620 [Anaerolineae bacterium]|nr:hypothetical protein [Anaerolineae bacterium]
MALKPGEEVVIDKDGLRYTQRPEAITTPDEVRALRERVAMLEVAARQAWGMLNLAINGAMRILTHHEVKMLEAARDALLIALERDA